MQKNTLLINNFESYFISEMTKMAEYYNHDIHIKAETVIKNNNNDKSAISVAFNDDNIAATIYTEDLYESFHSSNMSLDDFIEKTYSSLYNSHSNLGNLKLSNLAENCKDKLILKIVNKTTNPKMAELPHIEVAGDYIAVTYYLVCEKINERATTLVTQSFQSELLKLTDDELLSYAKSNSLNLDNYACKPLQSVIPSMMDEMNYPSDFLKELLDEPPTMYILSSKSGMDGAVAIASQEVLQELVPNVIQHDYPSEEEYYIIPSSIHEVLCIPASLVDNPQDLHDMCCEVNKTEVNESEVLGNNILHYSTTTQQLNVCNSIEELKTIHEASVTNKLCESISKTPSRCK